MPADQWLDAFATTGRGRGSGTSSGAIGAPSAAGADAATAAGTRIAAFGDLAGIASAHHERLDGKGYPRGLKGDQIALETRIITTADIFDALTADRPYRPAMPVTKALSVMAEMVDTAIRRRLFRCASAGLGEHRRQYRSVRSAKSASGQARPTSPEPNITGLAKSDGPPAACRPNRGAIMSASPETDGDEMAKNDTMRD